MLFKKGYLIHFARLFFASLLFGICSLFSYVWNKYQPFDLIFQLQRCQPTISIMKISHINILNWLENFHFIHLLPSFPFLTNSIIQKCHFYIKDDYPIDINNFIEFIHFILLIYIGYHLIQLLFFHYHLKQLKEKQYYYARLYQQDRKKKKKENL
ncbi:unnamed protein product [Rotaria sordida]|uniref:Transmembrane protein n=1 Tax=Rotaria sordida TaxID=392033 RepID=A0A818RVK2_9BILA|nr:unnamed protein product [Rotaria sordida]CAF1218659.1 unnamed protein product [Rotaria sordida]CAF1251751.1 unnamed protein product [Rotaria sordida]CAF1650449.1 unnamed protein product [Rotaria sordida]CAF3656413.1 unnamed protein product [Rotaria sordida]